MVKKCMWIGYKLSYDTQEKKNLEWVIKGPNLKSTINFKQGCSLSFSPHTDISHVSKALEKSNLHKPFYSFLNNNALKYNYRFQSGICLASNIS